MLGIKCLTCGRMAGSSSAACDDCKESFLSTDLVVMVMTAPTQSDVLGVYTRDPDTKEWVKEKV